MKWFILCMIYFEQKTKMEKNTETNNIEIEEHFI